MVDVDLVPRDLHVEHDGERRAAPDDRPAAAVDEELAAHDLRELASMSETFGSFITTFQLGSVESPVRRERQWQLDRTAGRALGRDHRGRVPILGPLWGVANFRATSLSLWWCGVAGQSGSGLCGRCEIRSGGGSYGVYQMRLAAEGRARVGTSVEDPRGDSDAEAVYPQA